MSFVLPEFKLIWLVSELLRLCAELCNEFKLLASLSINLLAASNLANRLSSDVGNPSTVGAVVAAGPSIIRIELLLSPSEMVKVIVFPKPRDSVFDSHLFISLGSEYYFLIESMSINVFIIQVRFRCLLLSLARKKI